MQAGHGLIPKVKTANLIDRANIGANTIWEVGVAQLAGVDIGVGVDSEEEAASRFVCEVPECARLHRPTLLVSAGCHGHVNGFVQKLPKR